ncbi:MAG: DUF3990 domain-containing protein [Clostridia bacterium]|nr:DUF3990 domain-containing protein [Clostridia bacterium]
MRLYHTGYQELRQPDVHFGRKNADFGQGFYLTANEAFAGKWARDRKGETIHINAYELNLDGLKTKRFQRGREWFNYLFANRRGQPDALAEYDVIMGPIANDTLYDTFGIITSGFLPPDQALSLLMLGPAYEQIALKTEKAASHLQWLSVRIPDSGEIAAFREEVRREEETYQAQFAKLLASF